MKLSEIKQKFIEYHNSYGYITLPDSGIISPDRTTLYTTSGMQQLRKRYEDPFNPNWEPQTSFQTCLRTDDLEEVGKTRRHLSLFVMLGCFNWNLSPYDLPEILSFSYKLLSEEFSLDPKRLFITVYGGNKDKGYQPDRFTYETWKSLGVSEKQLFWGGDDNYWQLGPDSVGGPCTEILYDRGKEFSCGQKCSPLCSDNLCDRYLEIYNLVLTQFKHFDGGRESLGCLNLDTGLGLERLGMIVQDVDSVQDTDIYSCFNKVKKSQGDPETKIISKQFLDCLRTLGYLLQTGISPSNTGEGYVVRKFIRRTLHLSRQLDFSEDDIWCSICDYWRQENIIEIQKSKIIWEAEVDKTNKLYSRGRKQVEKLLSKGPLSVQDYIKLWETHGLPKDIISEIEEMF